MSKTQPRKPASGMQFARASKCSMTFYTVFLQQTRQVHKTSREDSHFLLILGRPTKTSRPWTNSSTAVDGALSSQALVPRVCLTRTPDYNRCSSRYSPGSPPSLNGARYVYTPQESRYFHAPITSRESCNLIGSNRFLPLGLDSGQVFPHHFSR